MRRRSGHATIVRGSPITVWLALVVSLAAGPAALAQQLFAPSFTSTPVTTAVVGAPYSYSITVADLDLIDTITITASGLPGWLTLTDVGDRTATLTGTPGAGDVGPNVVTLMASDGVNEAMPQSFTITVAAPPPVASPPVAAPDSYTTQQDRDLNVNRNDGVLANDSNPNGGGGGPGGGGPGGPGGGGPGGPGGGPGNDLRAELVTGVAHGTLALAPDGSFRYTPAGGFSGTDTFTYRATNDAGSSDPATVTIEVTDVNEAPAASNDAYTTGEDTQLTVAAAQGVLANDSDPDGDSLTAAVTQDVDHGTLALAPDGSFIYMPSANFSGNDSFRYRANDGTNPSNEATVTITVSGGNDVPQAANDDYATDANRALTVGAGDGVLANDRDLDGDRLTAQLATNVSQGTLALNPDGSFTYTPSGTFSGEDRFTYTASDGTGSSSPATVTITVRAVNRAPTASADGYTTDEDRALTVPAANGVLANDSDPDGQTLTAVLVRSAADGSLTLRSDGSFTYTPPANFSGTTTFTYRASDGSATSDVATATITVGAVNDPPAITSSPPRTVDEGATYRYTLTATDADRDTLTIAAPTLPSWLTFMPPATISGTPQQANVGVHAVRLTVSDGNAPPVEQSFEITVRDVNNAPTIASIPAQVATEGAPFSLNLAQYVTDGDTPPASWRFSASGPLPPGLALSAAGVLSGTPALGTSVGQSTIRFGVSDGASTVAGRLDLNVLRAGRADLGVTVSAAPNPVATGAAATFTFTITNNAPDVAVDAATLEATIGGRVPFDAQPSPTPGCTSSVDADGTHLVCALGRLAGGATATATVAGSGTLPGDVLANAKVAIVGPVPIDETPENDTASAALSVAQQVSSSPVQDIPGIEAGAAAAGDLDGDGFDELVLATAQGALVLANTPDPANADKRALATTPTSLGGSLATDIALADLDLDQDLDIVTAAAAGAPSTVFVNASGAFTAVPLDDAADERRAVAVGDVNGDSLPDLVLAGAGGGTVFVNQGGGPTFARGASVGTHDVRDVALADLLGDALPELVVVNRDFDTEIFRNTGGAFALELSLATGAGSSIAVADLNRDGKNDLVIGRDATGGGTPQSNLVFLNTSSTRGAFFRSGELGSAPTASVLVLDVDLDQDPDVVAVNGAALQVYENAGAGTGTFALDPELIARRGARIAAAGRFGADARVDLAVAGAGVAVFYNDGAGHFGLGDTTGPTIQLLGPAEMTLAVGTPYTDEGATATDALDGDVSSRITVSNAVDPAVIGTYTVTYSATDLSGNAAAPATRTVRVQANATSEGGGGGAIGLEAALLALAALLRARRRG